MYLIGTFDELWPGQIDTPVVNEWCATPRRSFVPGRHFQTRVSQDVIVFCADDHSANYELVPSRCESRSSGMRSCRVGVPHHVTPLKDQVETSSVTRGTGGNVKDD